MFVSSKVIFLQFDLYDIFDAYTLILKDILILFYYYYYIFDYFIYRTFQFIIFSVKIGLVREVFPIQVKRYDWLNCFNVFIFILKVVLIIFCSDFFIHLDFAYCPFWSHTIHYFINIWNYNWGKTGKLSYDKFTDTIFVMCRYY